MPAEPNQPPSESITDSPWFWAGLFAAMALLALVVVAPKYAQRQGRLEQRFQNRLQTAPDQTQPSPQDPSPNHLSPAQPGLATARSRTSLLPIVYVVLLVLAISAAVLVRRRAKR